jgi:CYTH domain-containing protein
MRKGKVQVFRIRRIMLILGKLKMTEVSRLAIEYQLTRIEAEELLALYKTPVIKISHTAVNYLVI